MIDDKTPGAAGVGGGGGLGAARRFECGMPAEGYKTCASQQAIGSRDR